VDVDVVPPPEHPSDKLMKDVTSRANTVREITASGCMMEKASTLAFVYAIKICSLIKWPKIGVIVNELVFRGGLSYPSPTAI